MIPLDKVPLCFLFVSHFKHKYNIVAEFINIDAVGDAVVKITRWRSNANGIEKFFYAHDLAALGEYGSIGVSAVARNARAPRTISPPRKSATIFHGFRCVVSCGIPMRAVGRGIPSIALRSPSFVKRSRKDDFSFWRSSSESVFIVRMIVERCSGSAIGVSLVARVGPPWWFCRGSFFYFFFCFCERADGKVNAPHLVDADNFCFYHVPHIYYIGNFANTKARKF